MDEAKRVITLLTAQKKTLATAESCTGGLLGKLLTDVPGASAVYLGGVISYAYCVKEAFLGVDAALLAEKGAVCAEVAGQMAEGARERLNANIALATTGNAGPGADEKNPNVGEIYVACSTETQTVVKKLQLCDTREENRLQACRAALALLLQELCCNGLTLFTN